MQNKINKIQELIQDRSPEESLALLAKEFSGKVVFSTSLGYEDQVITHLIFSNNLTIEIFTLDTGRLFNETYSVLSSTLERYKRSIKVMYPPNKRTRKISNF